MSERSQQVPADVTESTVQLRAREAWGEYLLVVCLVGALLLGAGAWLASGAVADSGQTTEQRTVQLFEASGSFAHQATVRRDSRAFTSGETLSGRSLYYTSVTPVLDGTYQVSYTANGDAEMDVETQARLVIREIDEGTVFWAVTEVLSTDSVGSLEPGETATTSFSVNVTEVGIEADAIREELDAAPGSVESTVVVRTRLDGTVDGQAVSRTMDSRLGIVSDGSTYQIETEGATVAEERTETVVVESEPSTTSVAGGGALGVAGVAVLVASGVGWYRRSFDLTAAEEHAIVRSEFEDWITVAEVPTSAAEKESVDVSSLEGLVDLAIDTDGRVIQDVDAGQYVLLTEDYKYVFAPAHLDADAAEGAEEAVNEADSSPEAADEAEPSPAEPTEEDDDGGGGAEAEDGESADTEPTPDGSEGAVSRLRSLLSFGSGTAEADDVDTDEETAPDAEAEEPAPAERVSQSTAGAVEEPADAGAESRGADAETADASETTAEMDERPADAGAESASAGEASKGTDGQASDRKEPADAEEPSGNGNEAPTELSGESTDASDGSEDTDEAVAGDKADSSAESAEQAAEPAPDTEAQTDVRADSTEDSKLETATEAAADEPGREDDGTDGTEAAGGSPEDGSQPDASETETEAEELSGPFEGIPVVSGPEEDGEAPDADESDPTTPFDDPTASEPEQAGPDAEESDSTAAFDDIPVVGESDEPDGSHDDSDSDETTWPWKNDGDG